MPEANPTQTGVAVSQSNPIAGILKSNMKAIESVLPKHLTPERFMRTALEATRNPKLMQCDQSSLLQCFMDLSYLGLELGPLGFAYMIPYNGKATLQLGYKGLVALARRTGNVSKVETDVVREGDEFTYEKGLNSHLKHIPSLAIGREKKRITHAWAMFTMRDGAQQWDVMSKEQIDVIRDRSAAVISAKKYGRPTPWDSDYGEMAKKTVIKRVCKLLDLSPELNKAIEIDNNTEVGQPTKATVTVESPIFAHSADNLIQEAEVIEPIDEATGVINDPAQQIPDDPEGAGYGPDETPAVEEDMPPFDGKPKPALKKKA